MKTDQNHALLPLALAGVAMFAAFSHEAAAKPGDLDTTFGTTGRVSPASGSAWSVAIQPDGKVLVGGTSLLRLNVNGTLDTSFGGTGKAPISVSKFFDQGNCLTMQKDGKIVMVGLISPGLNGAARFNPDGTRDTSFGSGTGWRGYEPNGVAIQADEKIVIVGTASLAFPNPVVFALQRYHRDGSPDTSFGTAGRVISAIDPISAKARSVALQADGKILVVGVAGQNNEDAVLVRYNPDGSLDPSFGSAGVVREAAAAGWSLAVQNDGKIVVAGTRVFGSTTIKIGLWRYNADGSPDPDFDSNVAFSPETGTHLDIGYSIALQSDGKMVVAGASTSYSWIRLKRYNPDGSLEFAFQGTGTVIPADTNQWLGWAVAVQTDGKVVAAGTSGAMTAVRCKGDELMPFAAWKVAHLGQANPPDLGDPDGDGLSTLTEYGLGFLPETPSTAPAVAPFDYAEGRRLRMFVTRDPAHNDVTVEVQATGDVAGPWTTVAASVLGAPFAGAGYVSGDDATPGRKTVEVRDTVNVADAGRRFMRMRVTH